MAQIKHTDIHIIAPVGLAGSGKSTAVEYFTAQKVVLDGLYTWSEYKTLLHEFPGQVTVIAIVAPKQLRYQRLQNRLERPMQPHEIKERDWSEIENMEKGGPIAMADYFVINDGSLDKLHDQLHIAANDVHFCKAPAQC